MASRFFYITLCALVLLKMGTSLAPAQTAAKYAELFEDGEFFFWEADYKEAVYYYIQMETLKPGNANINFKIGECYINITGEEAKAIPYLELAIKKINPKYKSRSIDEKSAPPHAMYYLGNAYRMNNEIDKALAIYDKFMNSPYFYGHYNLSVVENEIRICEKAKLIVDRPINVEFRSLGDSVNDVYSNQKPVVSGDGKTLIYLTRLKFYDAIMQCKLNQDGSWSTPVNISPMVQSDGDMYPSGISSDGKTLLLIKTIKGQTDIYISFLDDHNHWSIAEDIGSGINTKSKESYASFSADNNTIYFSSNRKGGSGGFDIYFTTRLDYETWAKAKNIGKTINTLEDEITPFMSYDNKTLYFSSRGHENMGGFDIFYSMNTSGNQWTVPVNIGFPLNTTSDNTFFQPSNEALSGYSSLKRPEGVGAEDLYYIKILK
jgi:tetratricopeptide (TPR) repeat protein